jgi:hypothetical protein
MVQFPVVGYTLQVSTTPPQQPVAVEFIPGVVIHVQTVKGVRPVPLSINSPAEFMATLRLTAP